MKEVKVKMGEDFIIQVHYQGKKIDCVLSVNSVDISKGIGTYFYEELIGRVAPSIKLGFKFGNSPHPDFEVNRLGYELRAVDGKHLLYLNGEKLPEQVATTVEQDVKQASSGYCLVDLTVAAKVIDTID